LCDYYKTRNNIKLRLLIDSEPLLIIDKGKVIYKNMKKAEQTAVTVGDMNIEKSKTGMMVDKCEDGNILSSHLSLIQKDEKWVMSQLKARNIYNIKDVIFAGVQPDEQIYIVTKYS